MPEKFTKEQVATLLVFAWNEGYDWCGQQRREEPLHPGSIRYLREKAGAGLGALDEDGKAKAKQLLEVI